MDFFNDDNDTTACDICGDNGHNNIGKGSYNQVTGMFSFYLCPVCAAAEAKRQAEADAENQRRIANAIAMHMTMD